LPYRGAQGEGPRSLFCVDLRAVETTWAQRPLEEVRHMSRGGRLSQICAGLDLDPRRSLARNAAGLMPARAQQLFDALCEELADAALYDVPRSVWLALLPLLAPHGHGESPYPGDAALPSGEALREGLVVLAEGRVSAETATVALSSAVYPKGAEGGELDPALWADIVAALHPMLEAVRDQQRALLIEA
jgi:hypothetical protein